MKLETLMELIEKHSDILKPKYSNYNIDVGFGGDECELIDVFIHTKVKRSTKKLLQKIKVLFDATDVGFIGQEFGKENRCKKCHQWENTPFFSISYKRQKVK